MSSNAAVLVSLGFQNEILELHSAVARECR